MKMQPRFTAVFMLLLPSFLCLAQRFTPDNYVIDYIGMDNGLMHNFVDDIYRDERGFVWFATGNGLSRFDGYEFVHYSMNSSPVGLKGNSVHKVCEDDFGRLWIASDGGLDVLSLSEQKLVDLFTGADCDFSFSNQTVLNLEKDAKGDFWLFSINTLYKIVLNAEGEIESVFKLTIDDHPVRYIAMADIDGDGNIWIGVSDKILKAFVDNGNETIRTQPVSQKLVFPCHTQVNKILWKENEVWMATDRGLYRYFKNEDAVKIYVHDANDERSISQDFVTDLCVTSSKMLIASTLNGINSYQPSTDRFERVCRDENSTKIRLNSNFVNCLFSSGDILWIGTETGGVNKITPRNVYVKIYTHQENTPGSISKNPVNAILEDRDGNLWVGTVEGGLNLKRKGTNFFEHFTTVSSARLGHNSVSALSIDDKDRLWVGTWGNGVTILDRKHPSKPASKYLNAAREPGFLIDFVGALQYDKINRGMWLGTNQGLYFYDLNTETLKIPFSDQSSSAISNIVGSAIDENNRLWVGCDEGVYVVDLNRGGKDFFSYTHYQYKPDDPQSRLIDKITCIHLDSKGVLWLGSDRFGLYRRIIDKQGNVAFKAYTMADGLASNNVRGILEDDSGNLWISTTNGLSFLDRESLRFSNLYKEDGLGSNQFYWNAYCKTADGTLYFGTVDGLVGIDAESIFSNVQKYKVTLTNVVVNNRPVFPGKCIDADISISKRMVIHEKEKSFRISFSALNYFSTYNYVYSYRLLGYDENWIEVPKNEHSAAYMNLPPGKYIFQVKYTPKNRKDFGEITPFEIRIKPYFYKTFWFKSLMVAFVLFLILSWYFWRIRSTNFALRLP
jgi:ligand-binding sensor domain-containing protein